LWYLTPVELLEKLSFKTRTSVVEEILRIEGWLLAQILGKSWTKARAWALSPCLLLYSEIAMSNVRCVFTYSMPICNIQLCDGRRAQSEEDSAVDGQRTSRPNDDDAALQSVQTALQQSTRLRERHQGVPQQYRLSSTGILLQRWLDSNDNVDNYSGYKRSTNPAMSSISAFKVKGQRSGLNITNI